MSRTGQAAREAVPPEAVLTPAAVADRLGVAVATLRSWDRRHGLGPSAREPGRHRRYTVGDLRRLERVVHLVRQGVPVASAAATVSAGGVPPAIVSGRVADRVASRRRRSLRGAAEKLDPDAFRRIVVGFLDRHGTIDTWQKLLVPFLQELGERCAEPGGPVEVEHLATDGIIAALHALPAGNHTGPASVLLACAPDEQHSLPLEVLRHALAERGKGTISLGARVPPHSLLTAVTTRKPVATVVWAHSAELASQVPAGELSGTRLYAAGPGWEGVPLPGDARRLTSLPDAVEALS
ncbi:MerR family transcriptional regulator [Amycolatopsis thermophila]|uniref:DNA-binding transcriptional MerR regulator n=1 Tax=Amycolatopsis thermophila TaxID=206084 RepID=A0ABU0ELK6_9PSEU|nr:MerR family transcriptional regulator [Amycolatopsis thermophila]MDQ0376173.1 DNA-binding transcriptional MerR regulator [Amycolatopsis thermophila]